MFFVFPITIPPSTAQNLPVQITIQLAAGTITKVDVQFPLGVSALASLIISDGLFQLFPTNQDGAFSTSNETITWTEDYDITDPPYTLLVSAWNLDPINQHTLTVRIAMLPLTTPSPSIANEIAQFLGESS